MVVSMPACEALVLSFLFFSLAFGIWVVHEANTSEAEAFGLLLSSGVQLLSSWEARGLSRLSRSFTPREPWRSLRPLHVVTSFVTLPWRSRLRLWTKHCCLMARPTTLWVWEPCFIPVWWGWFSTLSPCFHLARPHGPYGRVSWKWGRCCSV